MVGHHREYGYLLKNLPRTSRTGVWIVSTLLACIFFTVIGCKSSHTDSKSGEISFKDNHVVYTKWDDVFENDTVIPFSFPDPSVEVYSINWLWLVPDGGYIIADLKAKKTIQTDAKGRFIRYIGGVGVGPGELTRGTGRGVLGGDKNLYLFDFFTGRINKYIAPDYHFEKVFILTFYSQDYILDDHGNFIHYTTQDPSVLHKIGPTGKILKKAFQVNNLNFRLFSARFQIGQLAEIPGEGFLFSYPEEYKVYWYNNDLNIKRVLYTTAHSRFFPEKAVFPNTLSPADYSPAHAKWWDSALRPGPLSYLGNGFFVQELFQFKKLELISFINIHDLNGTTYAVGLEEPFNNSYIRAAHNGYIYLVEDSVFDPAGNPTPVKLHRYKLKNSIFPKSK